MRPLLAFACAIILLFPASGFAGAQAPKKAAPAVLADKRGTSLRNAIYIKDIGDFTESIQQERVYLEGKFGVQDKDWRISSLKTIEDNGRLCDRITVELVPSGKQEVMYFDITGIYKALEGRVAMEAARE